MLVLVVHNFSLGFGLGLDLKKLVSLLASESHSPGLGLRILASFNISI